MGSFWTEGDWCALFDSALDPSYKVYTNWKLEFAQSLKERTVPSPRPFVPLHLAVKGGDGVVVVPME